ncbi:hypothetical protein CATMIT_01982, partial [Catenibacterium mitsuokai DSM 15897]
VADLGAGEAARGLGLGVEDAQHLGVLGRIAARRHVDLHRRRRRGRIGVAQGEGRHRHAGVPDHRGVAELVAAVGGADRGRARGGRGQRDQGRTGERAAARVLGQVDRDRGAGDGAHALGRGHRHRVDGDGRGDRRRRAERVVEGVGQRDRAGGVGRGRVQDLRGALH